LDILEKSYRIIAIRVGVSLLLFVGFVIAAVFAVLSDDAASLSGIVLVGAASILVLPRYTVPPGFKPESKEQREMWTKLSRVRIWLAYVRAAYFVTAVFIVLGLPELI
jgi:hypothetical protein